MKNIFLIIGLLYVSFVAYSQSGSVTVSGAGVPEINATYTFYAIGTTGRPEYRVGGDWNQRIAFVLPANKWAMVYNDPAPGTGLRYCNDSQAMDVPITGWYTCNEGYLPVPSSILITPLPVKLKTFTADLNINLPLISFTTASEINNVGFDIERLSNGIDFVKIGWVDGHGNSNKEIHYTFVDKDPLTGKNYYQLKQVDYDGRFEYSQIVSVSTASEDFSIFPNPTSDKLYLQGHNGQDVVISSMTLGLIKYFEAYETTEGLDISDLPPGMYLLQVKESRTTLRFVKM